MGRPSKAVYALHPVTRRQVFKFSSVFEAATAMKCNRSHISKAINKSKSLRGYIWVFEDRLNQILDKPVQNIEKRGLNL